ncbi:hypothetical protein XM25_10965 [Devosia sp. H5989]|nr:hypothetical protein XM25_10965 [Devosia sp. H5989]
MLTRLGLSLLLAALPASAMANDSMAQLGAGGLSFITNDKVQMLSEDLSISAEEVKVVYEFKNSSDEDQHTLVAFPLPDIMGSGDFIVSIPTEDPQNIFGFETTFNGKPVEATLHQYVFAFGIDQTDYLKGLGIPLTPYGQDTIDKLNALPEADKNELMHRGLVIPMEYDAGQGWQTDMTPVWTLKSTYSWEADFKAGAMAEVVHKYKPSVGGTVAVTFLSEPYDDYDPASEYQKKYCTDESFIKAVRKTLTSSDDPYSAPFTESWISYIWSTGNNWSGPIGKFHLTVDKGAPENLVSFCGTDVRKTGSTTFEMTATDFYPPYNHELEILILNRQKPQ